MLSGRSILGGLAALALGGAVFFGVRAAIIQQAPKTVMTNIQNRIAAGAGGWNACYHNRVYGPRAAAARRANPDSIISSMAYDLSDGPVRVSGVVWPRYWSLSLYQQNSDNFFVINDKQVPKPEFDFLIAKQGQATTDIEGVTILTSPTTKGIMLVRRFAAEATDMPGIIENQDAMSCGLAANSK